MLLALLLAAVGGGAAPPMAMPVMRPPIVTQATHVAPIQRPQAPQMKATPAPLRARYPFALYRNGAGVLPTCTDYNLGLVSPLWWCTPSAMYCCPRLFIAP